MKSRERILSAIGDLKTKAEEYEEAGRRLLDVAGQLELAAEDVFEQTRSTTGLIAGEFREDFGRKGESRQLIGFMKEYSTKENTGDEFDHWLASHREEVKRMVCGNPDYEQAAFCHVS